MTDNPHPSPPRQSSSFHSYFLLLLLTVSAFGAEYKIVVHHLNPTTSLSKAVVADYFLKKKRTWPDDRPVVVVDQAISSRR